MKVNLPIAVPFDAALDDITDTAPPVEETVAQRIALRRLIELLDERERRILGYLGEELTYAEMAVEEGVSLRAIKRLAPAVRAKARAFLETQL